MHSKAGMELVSFRLESGADIRRDLEHLIKRDNISAAVVLGAVGSLSNVCLRFAGQNRHTTLEGSYEILTLSGTLGEGGVHLHMSVADEVGECKGGHVVYGCRVNTTLELVIGLLPDVTFLREMDEETGYKELKISSTNEQSDDHSNEQSSDHSDEQSDEQQDDHSSEPVDEQSEENPDKQSDEQSDEQID